MSGIEVQRKKLIRMKTFKKQRREKGATTTAHQPGFSR